MCLKLRCSGKRTGEYLAPDDYTLDSEPVLRSNKLPIVYRPEYGVTFCGLQRLHPFDAAKGEHIYKLLKAGSLIKNDDDVYKPPEISTDKLLDVHTKRYIESLKVWPLST